MTREALDEPKWDWAGAIDALVDAVWLVSSDGRVVRANQAAHRQSAQPCDGRLVWDCVPETLAPHVKTLCTQAPPTESTAHVGHYSPQPHGGGLLLVHHDAEARLSRTRRVFGLLRDAGVGVWEWRVGDDEAWVSPAVPDADGEHSMVSVDTWTARLHPEDRVRRDAMLDALLAAPETAAESTFEYRQRGESDWRWFRQRARLTMPGGTPVLTGVYRDITERKAARRQLERAHQLFARGPVAAFQWSAGPDWPILWVSDNIRELTGYDARVFLSGERSYGTLIHPDDLGSVRASLDAQLQANAPIFSAEYRIVCASGEERWVSEHTIIHRNPAGEPANYDGFLIDITKRRAAEAERLELAERVAASQRLEALGILAGGVAHDFNNLLVGMVGSLDLLKLEMTSPDAEALIATANESAERAMELSARMLAVSGGLGFVRRQVELGAGMMRAARNIRRASSVPIELDGALDCPPVWGDATLLERVWTALLQNAAEAETVSRIHIRAHRAEPGAPCAMDTPRTAAVGDLSVLSEPHVVVHIEDDGAGMTPDVLQHAFDPFFSTKFVGRGLGLAAVFGIIRAHHGAVFLESSPQKGTIVRVALPLWKNERSSTSKT